MSAETKRREILQMLSQGSITAEEASELLEQTSQEAAGATLPESGAISDAPVSPEVPAEPGKQARWLHVKVTDAASGRNKVNVRIPLSLARIGLRMGAKFAPELEDLDWSELLSELTAGGTGTIIEVQDEEDGELVQVYVS